jgi:hypothetical protein
MVSGQMRFREVPNLGNWLTIDVAEQSPEGQPDAGDVRFAMRLRFGNHRDQVFFAKTHAWVRWEALRQFVEQLELVERRREGTARLASMSPGELELTIEVVDRAGHVVVHGQLGRHIYGARRERLWASLPFEIRFDPTELPFVLEHFRGVVSGVG